MPTIVKLTLLYANSLAYAGTVKRLVVSIGRSTLIYPGENPSRLSLIFIHFFWSRSILFMVQIIFAQ